MISPSHARRLRSLARTIAIAICSFALARNATALTDYPFIVEDPPRSPQEQLKSFHLPPGFEIQLVAAEPEVHKPMNFNFDAAGRLWFTGSVEYPYPKAANAKGRDTLRIIHGFNPDGSATKITTFADDLNIPIGVTPINTHEAIVFSVPNEYRLRDEDGDGFADKRDVLFGPFGQRDTHGLNNSFTYGDRRLGLRLPRIRQQQPRERNRRPARFNSKAATSTAFGPTARTSSTSRTDR